MFMGQYEHTIEQRAELSFLQSTEKGLERLLLSPEVWMAAYIYTRQTLGRSLQTSCKVFHLHYKIVKSTTVSIESDGGESGQAGTNSGSGTAS